MAVVLTNLPKPGEEQRYVDVINGSGGKQRLCVDAALSGTITIGDIVITDPITATDANVVLTSSGLGGLVVVPQPLPYQSINNFGSSAIATGAALILVTYTVPAGKKFTFSGGVVGGSGPGEFRFKINSATICLVRNSGSTRTVNLTFPFPPEATAGAIIDIHATNIDNKNWNYEALISGMIQDV